MSYNTTVTLHLTCQPPVTDWRLACEMKHQHEASPVLRRTVEAQGGVEDHVPHARMHTLHSDLRQD